MKKYNAPVARIIDLHAEGELLTNSLTVNNQEGGGHASNERSDFGSIWDSED